jgi:hypothetical protein
MRYRITTILLSESRAEEGGVLANGERQFSISCRTSKIIDLVIAQFTFQSTTHHLTLPVK